MGSPTFVFISLSIIDYLLYIDFNTNSMVKLYKYEIGNIQIEEKD